MNIEPNYINGPNQAIATPSDSAPPILLLLRNIVADNTGRLQSLTGNVDNITAQLFGETDCNERESLGADVNRTGELGALHDTIDSLTRNLLRAEQAVSMLSANLQ